MTEKSTKEKLQQEGLLSAVFTNHHPWFMAIWEQPCLVMPSEVANGTTYDPSSSSSVSTPQRLLGKDSREDFLTRNLMKDSNDQPRAPASLLLLGFMREVVGLIVHNPWLYWKQFKYEGDTGKDMWRGIYRDPETKKFSNMSIMLNPATKLLFCIVKIFGSPLILVYFAARFFYVFMVALNIPQFGSALAYSLLVLIDFIPGISNTKPVSKFIGRHNYYTELDDGTFKPEPVDSVPFATAIKYYGGMIIPLQLFGSREMAETYGKGGLSILIIVFMIISAFIIIIGGINILVICVVFFVYMFKTIEALKTSAMGK